MVPFPILFLLASLLASQVIVAQTVSSATYTVGGANVPSGADPSKSSVDIIDSDLFDNNELSLGLTGFFQVDEGGNWVSDDVNTRLWCDGSHVRGSDGTSGENPAEVFLKVTFRDSAGNVINDANGNPITYETATQDVRCL